MVAVVAAEYNLASGPGFSTCPGPALPSAGRERLWPQSGSSACSWLGTDLSAVAGDLLVALKGLQSGGLGRLTGPPSCLPGAEKCEGSDGPLRLEGLQALGAAAQSK